MQTASVPTKTHAKFSPSSSERWMACAGSIQLSEKAPPGRESAYAREGTDAHFCLEALLKAPAKRLQTEAFLRKKYGAQMVAHASSAYDKIMSLVPKGAELLVETKVDLSFIAPDMGGTLDVAVVELFGTLTVVDYKYGAGIPVEPEQNSQLVSYALAIAHKYGYNFERVVIGILQPRAEHDRGTYREWVTNVTELFRWRDRFTVAVQRAKKKDAPLKAGSWCRFCPAAPICPEISTKALADAQVVFSDSSLDDMQLPVPNKSGIAIADLPKILTAIDRVEDWIGKVREHALHVAESGEKIDGFKLVQKRSTRKWTDIEAAGVEAVRKFGTAALSEPELLSPAQLEKAIGKEHAGWIAERVSNISSGTTLVSDTDSREAVDVGSVFTAIEPAQAEKPLKPKKKERKHGKR